MAFGSLNTRQLATPLQAESSAVLAARFLAGRYGTLLMTGSGGLSGDVTANIQRKAKRAAEVDILTMAFCIKLLLMCLMRWWKTRIIFSASLKD